MKLIEPSTDKVSFNCPHCGTFSHQKWAQLGAVVYHNNTKPFLYKLDRLNQRCMATDDTHEKNRLRFKIEKILNNKIIFSNESVKASLFQNLHYSQCASCEDFSIWLNDSLIFPSIKIAPLPSEDLPIEIKIDYEEAREVLDKSPRSSIALLRLCVQKLCDHLGAEGKNINEQIGDLVKKGLSPQIQKSLDILRVFGNSAVHPLELDLKDAHDIALSLFNLINIICNEMITRPKEINNLYEMLPDRAKKAIEKRDSKD